MSDKSFGDYANRNIMKNPLLSTAVTGLSIEDLTHNAVLVPVAPNQALITGLDQSGTYTQTLANTDYDLKNFPSGDSNSNIVLPNQPSISTHSLPLDSQTSSSHDVKPELLTSTVSKASAKSEDDFDVNEYFARLQGTRYVSAPLHSHQDPNANLTAQEENLEEINLNDDKNVEVQQSLTADIAQNFSQLPNVLPHVASAVFSSFSNMWNMKSREQTPDDRTHSYQDLQYQRNQELNQFQSNQSLQSYQDVHFQGSQVSGVNQFHEGQVLSAHAPNVPLMSTEDVVKEVAPPPKEPPICGASNFRLPTKKKYAQIPGLSTGESKPIAFNPLNQNVPSYFIPTAVAHEDNKESIAQESFNTAAEQKPHNVKEHYNIFSPADTDMTAGASDCQPNVFMPTESQPILVEETPPLPPINLQNQVPVIPPPPMFSTIRKDSLPGKSVLPPSVARRIGSNHPVIKQQTTLNQPTVTGHNIFIPTFESAPTAGVMDPNLPPASEPTSKVPTYSSQMFAPNINPLGFQDTPATLPPTAPPQIPHSSTMPGPPPKTALPPSSQSAFPLSSRPDTATNLLPIAKAAPTASSIFNPSVQSAAPGIFTPGMPDLAQETKSLPPNSSTIFPPQGPPSLPPSSNIFSAPMSQPTFLPGPTQPTIGTAANIGPTLFTPQSASYIPPPLSEPLTTTVPSQAGQPPISRPPLASSLGQPTLFTPPTPIATLPLANKEDLTNDPPKPLMEPPKAIGASNFRMIKKRPQYYSGPIEGIGSISNSIKPVIPTVDSGTFQGALFTPEQTQADPNVASFDISKPTDTVTSNTPYDITKQASFDTNPAPYSGQQTTYPSFDMSQPAQDYGQLNTAFDLSRPTTDSYEHKEEPKESKGFGIIGSLKSKLSSIDINKIQSSVTTFFDPTYNDSKKDPVATQENVPYNAPQYQSLTQNNYEIFVPNADPSLPFNYNYQAHQSAFGLVNPGYQSEYNNQSAPYEQNVHYQSYSTSYYSDDQSQNLVPYEMSNVYAQETNKDKPTYPPAKSEHTTAKSQETKDAKSTEKNIDDAVANIHDEVTNVKPVNAPVADSSSEIEKESNLQQYIDAKQEEKAPKTATERTHITGLTELSDAPFDAFARILPGHTKASYPRKTAHLTTTDPNTLFEMTSNFGAYPLNQARVPSDPIAKEIKPNTSAKGLFDNNEKAGVLPSFGLPNVSSFNKPFDNKEKEFKPVDLFTSAQRDITRKAEVPKNDLLESLSKDVVPILGVSSVPLFGLSAIVPDKSNEKDDINLPLYDKAKSIDMLDRNASLSFFENFGPVAQKPFDVCENNPSISMSFFEKGLLEPVIGIQDSLIPCASFFTSEPKFEESDTVKNVGLPLDRNPTLFDNIGAVAKIEEFGLTEDVVLDSKQEILDNNENAELNICETCREVNKSDEREIETDDLTLQLIENITSPIQLSNAVEVPLTEDNDTQREVEFDAGQFEEISHITEDTIETIHVQSATELLEDDDVKITNYGWSIDESFVTNPAKHSDFNYTVGQNSISFFGDSLFRDNVPANASDELKAEFKSQEDVIPRELSVPSAPPAEEDSKSDEAGILDVNSIELDAKEDFPIYEEYVIEPSETDDDKIEFKEKEKSEERVLDSFTNRVEKFKKMEEVADFDDHSSVPKFFDLPSQPISMASYFDTGNYAADTHYRNTLNAPSPVSIPPGFEEEFKKRIALAKSREGGKSVPDTQTQTKTTISLSYSTANTFKTVQSIMPVGFDVEDNVSSLVEDQSEKVPEESSIFTTDVTKMPEAPLNFGNVSHVIDDNSEKLPQASVIFASGDSKIREASHVINAPIIAADNNEKVPQASSMFASGVILPEPPLNLGNIPNIDDRTEKLLQTSSIFAADGNKMPEAPPKFGDASNVFEDNTEKLPQISSIFASRATELPGQSSFASASGETSKLSSVDREEIRPAAKNILSFGGDKMPDASNMFTLGQSNEPGPSLSNVGIATVTDKKPDAPTLPDPMNFFADTPAAEPAENFSRLASYFNTPPKTDHAKSFFELSQSQNHYRHAINQDKYHDLIKDLTSVQNLAVPTDQTIRHVNYFTVEYDVVSPEFSKGDRSKDAFETDDKDLESLSNCRFCTNLIYDKTCKVKTAMNDNSEARNTVPNMESPSSVNRNSMTAILNFEGIQSSDETNEGVAAMSENRSSPEYSPVKHHWFYRVDIEGKSIWRGFSVTDTGALETAFLSSDLNENTLVATDGGRYDVNVVGRLRIPVYWIDKPTNVRRCSWFYKGTTDPRYVPYTESVADKLETEYHHGMTTGEWHRRLVLPNGEVVVMHGPNVMVHFITSDGFSSPPLFSFGKRVYRNPPKIRVSKDQPEKIDHLIFMVHGAGEYRIQREKMDAIKSSSRPRVVRRGHDESEIEDPEPSSIDHLLLMCHGVGSACDMRFRSVEEVVEDFRSTSLQLVQSHYKNSYDQGIVSRVEVLPISWHATLHSGETGVDRRLAQITLDSIPRLRSFTNETVLDVLFYTSPVFCQTILNTVCKELNRIYKLFIECNPSFNGGVSLGGHSLGSVILYDLLCHQTPEDVRRDNLQPDKSYVSGLAGTGQPYVHYPILHFEPAALYALGSPIAIFECIRGVESLGVDFSLPTCKNFFNIFHPYDPIAYRIEPLINPLLRDLKPYLIPHHKGRKRMHLELKDTMARVGADLKQKLIESLRSTWNKWKSQPVDGALERVVEEEIEKEPLNDDNKQDSAKEKELSTPQMLGRLNAGRRVDYVLQEAPLEMINEYLFAMSSHVGYWESEDTMLLMLREIYSALGIQPDSTVPQQSMTVQRTRMTDTKIMVNADYPSTSGNAP